MPINTKAYDFLSVYLSTKSFPEVETLPELSEAEITELYESLNLRFSGQDGEWMCFMGSSPGISGFGDSKIKALAYLLNRMGIKAEEIA